MKYYSLNRQSPDVSFKEATILGQAPDKGLYFPESIPQVDAHLIRNIESYSNDAIAYEVIRPYVGNDLDEKELQRIVEETVNFPSPLVPIHETIEGVLKLYRLESIASNEGAMSK